ncbi:thiamine pyrophosphate-binding protein [Serratia nevei]|uniref:alpha-keto acid decarboxylase family protein n=1 Tax=Serratia nevei TaxID=2703794 RepID=UPI002543B7A8|nr:thiamine pyrophosphate-binding protein [Serratia nevei]EMB4110344.1 indolepyruvate decarboxylase [Serratia marcescens]WIJ62486.1 thiamine pyrophosphate-binding protein [Serratia nevei]
MAENYTVADYLLDRLAQIGIRHVFGVPGDYNLQFLDHVIAHRQIAWVGCANELNAAYAADGYARCKTAAALLTTFGVGELSAINGTAGSYAEYVPVIHVVGAPALRVQQGGSLLHHSLGDGDFGHFARMAKEVTVAQSCLTVENAEAEIDRLLTSALFERRPVYLVLPCDVAEAPLTSRPMSLTLRQAELSEASLQGFIAAAVDKLQSARWLSVLAGGLAERFNVTEALGQWMAEVEVPHATLLLGKGALDETHAGFTGTYAGAASLPQVKQWVEEADVVINVGVLFIDTVTAGFSHRLPAEKCISLHPFEARVGQRVFSQIPMHVAIHTLHQLSLRLAKQWRPPMISRPTLTSVKRGSLDQNAFWRQIQDFLRPGDIIFTEQGTACFGAAALRLPQGCKLIVQSLWASVGYTLAAAFGAQTAEPERRVLVFIGDGAAQFTAQELGSMLRDGLKPVIFLLNNGGYTVERAIHGPEQRYHDIARWNWTLLPQALAGEHSVQVLSVTESEQLQQALRAVADNQQFAFIEVVLPSRDIPALLNSVSRALQMNNGMS